MTEVVSVEPHSSVLQGCILPSRSLSKLGFGVCCDLTLPSSTNRTASLSLYWYSLQLNRPEVVTVWSRQLDKIRDEWGKQKAGRTPSKTTNFERCRSPYSTTWSCITKGATIHPTGKLHKPIILTTRYFPTKPCTPYA